MKLVSSEGFTIARCLLIMVLAGAGRSTCGQLRELIDRGLL